MYRAMLFCYGPHGAAYRHRALSAPGRRPERIHHEDGLIADADRLAEVIAAPKDDAITQNAMPDTQRSL
jgi:hypothetical protein